jgi:hypothetical protein
MSIYENMSALLIGVPKEDALDGHISMLIEDVQEMIVSAAYPFAAADRPIGR